MNSNDEQRKVNVRVAYLVIRDTVNELSFVIHTYVITSGGTLLLSMDDIKSRIGHILTSDES
jgi:hypothetical protein